MVRRWKSCYGESRRGPECFLNRQKREGRARYAIEGPIDRVYNVGFTCIHMYSYIISVFAVEVIDVTRAWFQYFGVTRPSTYSLHRLLASAIRLSRGAAAVIAGRKNSDRYRSLS